jgi:hypothetical protein
MTALRSAFLLLLALVAALPSALGVGKCLLLFARLLIGPCTSPGASPASAGGLPSLNCPCWAPALSSSTPQLTGSPAAVAAAAATRAAGREMKQLSGAQHATFELHASEHGCALVRQALPCVPAAGCHAQGAAAGSLTLPLLPLPCMQASTLAA